MENLRWILIFAGVAILVLLYVSGRSSGGAARRRDARAEPDPLLGDERAPGGTGTSRRGGSRGGREAYPDAAAFDPDGFDVDPDDLQRPGAPSRASQAPRRATARPRVPVHEFESVSEADFDTPLGYADDPAPAPARARPHGRGPGLDRDHGYGDDYGQGHGHGHAHDREYDYGHEHDDVPDPGPARGVAGADETDGASGGAAAALGGIGRRIESLGARFGAGRREAEPAGPEPVAGPAPTTVVTLHVVSPDGTWFDGDTIAETFEARGYAFGEMDIFHSMHRGRIVFSIAKMVEPGRFDPDDLDSFATPGLVMILQLPGPVPADAAFEVLLSEAHELAARLDARVLDGERSTLSKQSAQHMRDGIREFMHRRKFYDGGAG